MAVAGLAILWVDIIKGIEICEVIQVALISLPKPLHAYSTSLNFFNSNRKPNNNFSAELYLLRKGLGNDQFYPSGFI